MNRRLKQPEIGNLIQQLRQELGLTQEQFAAQLGVAFPTLNRWENKHATPSPLAMEKIEAVAQQLRGDQASAVSSPQPHE